MKMKVTKHVYIWKYGVREVANGEQLSSDNISVTDSPDNSTELKYYLCPVEIEVDVPSEEQAQLMELAGLEKEAAAYRKEAINRMQVYEQRIAELKAITYQE